jgi:hypothetical protein
MRRRDFLYNTGLLIPALLASPAWALASQKTIRTDVLIIHRETGSLSAVTKAMNEWPIQGHQLSAEQISHLAWSREGFLITTSDNTLLQAQKIIMHAGCRVNVPKASMEINIGQKIVHLNYESAKEEHKTVPEYWFLKTNQFLAHKTNHFLNRNKPVLLCLSGS